MTEQELRRGGGGKLSRSETVTVRLDPKLRYLAELAGRLHRRTLSSYIEWAIKASLDAEPVRPNAVPNDAPNDRTIGSEAEFLWDVDDADRFAKLALRYPQLLTHEEQVRWKLIRECPGLWRGNYDRRSDEWVWLVHEETIIFTTLRTHWKQLCDVADGRTPANALPDWLTSKVKPPTESGVNDSGDDCTF
jgi:hypothetical protein